MNLTDPEDCTAVVTAIVTIASLVANFIPPHTIVGKVLHWMALNIKKH